MTFPELIAILEQEIQKRQDTIRDVDDNINKGQRVSHAESKIVKVATLEIERLKGAVVALQIKSKG